MQISEAAATARDKAADTFNAAAQKAGEVSGWVVAGLESVSKGWREAQLP